MNLTVVGINHRTAPVALREKIAFAPDQLGHALHDLKTTESLAEVAILSTCNRTEVYAIKDAADPESIGAWLAQYHRMDTDELREALYVHTGPASVRHLLRVASGLDSMVLGEPQILGQLKDSFINAKEHATLGPTLEQLSQQTWRIAKRVRSSTAIGQNPVSVASIAVDLAGQLFADVSTCAALLIGAGETIELVGKHLINAGCRHVTIANRSLGNAEKLAAALGGEAVQLSDIPDALVNADIVIASTGSQLPILGKGTVERALKERRHRPIFMVDLAVPRDIEHEIGDLRDIYLYSIDDLEQLIAENISNREAAAEEAEEIITSAITEIEAEHRSRDAVDLLVRFRRQHESVKEAELAKAVQRLERGEDPAVVLKGLANQLTNKMIHTPSVQLKQASIDGRVDILEAITTLYQLDDDQN